MPRITRRCPECETPFHVVLDKPVIGAICPACQAKVIVKANAEELPTKPAIRRPLVRATVAVAVVGIAVVGAVVLIKNRLGLPAESEQDANSTAMVGKVKFSEANIRRAVNNGVAYLKRRLRVDSFATPYGYWRGGKSGAAALAGLTLLACGVSKTDPAVEQATKIVRHDSAQQRFTYGLSLSYLFLARLNEPGDETIRRQLVLRLVAGKNRDGLWGYWCPILTESEERAVLADLKKGVPIHGDSGADTRSASEFAMMALWTARKNGLPVDALLRSAADQFRIAQRKNGSWNYMQGGGDTSNDSMTCAGLRALAIGHALKYAAGSARQDPNIDRGLRYLNERVLGFKRLSDEQRRKRTAAAREFAILIGKTNRTKKENDRLAELLQSNSAAKGALIDAGAWGDVYFLWSLQRTATAFGVRKLGSVDWYRWGTPIILENQSIDGGWREAFPGIPDTCFALLFLKQADLFDGLSDMLNSRLQLVRARH